MLTHNKKAKKYFLSESSKKRRNNIYSIILIVIMLSLSVLYLDFAWNRYKEMKSSEAMILAQSLKTLLHSEHIAKLSGSEEDIDKPEYTMLKLSLSKLVATTNPIRFAYVLGAKDGHIIIFADSESPDLPDYSPPGQIYEEADEIIWAPFKSGNSVLTYPVTDRWGTWISALVPIKDPSNDKVIAVFGIDYSVSEWNLDLWQHMIPDIIIVICLIVVFLALIRIWNQHSLLKNISEKLAFSESLYRNVFNQAPVGIAIVNDKSFLIKSDIGKNANPMFEKILGRTNNELENIEWTEITHPDDLQTDLDYFKQFKSGKISGYSMEKRYIKPDGSIVWVNMIVASLALSNQYKSYHMCLVEDITKRKEIESERSKSMLLSNIPGMAYRCNYDREWTMQYVSSGCLELTGYTPQNILHNRDISFNELITPDYREILWNEWARIISKRSVLRYEYEITTANGERKWVYEIGQGVYNEKGETLALEGIIIDISDRKKMEDQLRYNDEHDVLTGLQNRKALLKTLEYDANVNFNEKRAVVGINMTSIYSLSIAYGFSYSQYLFKKIADILQPLCDNNRRLFNTFEYRLLFYVKNYKDKSELEMFCGVVAKTVSSIISTERINVGIGVIEIDKSNEHDTETLLKNLLIASQNAIDEFDNDIEFRFFDQQMEAQIIREEIIINELIQICRGKGISSLFLQYQPILDISSNQICAFEALARIKSDSLGIISPLEFIPIAEKSKMIINIGERIILNALFFLKELKKKGYDKIAVSINISAIQLVSKDFTKNLIQMINEFDIKYENVGIEITESVFTYDYVGINNILEEVKKYGIKIAIDDFGTGYSSLARERELNVDCLKIDKYFIDKLMLIEHDNAITGDIISMGHKLGHCIIAEGVEHEIQKQYLIDKGCDKIQGYLISKPLDEAEAIELMNKQNNTYFK